MCARVFVQCMVIYTLQTFSLGDVQLSCLGTGCNVGFSFHSFTALHLLGDEQPFSELCENALHVCFCLHLR